MATKDSERLELLETTKITFVSDSDGATISSRLTDEHLHMKIFGLHSILIAMNMVLLSLTSAGQFTVVYSTVNESFVSTGDRFGEAVSTAGDCNGDGYDDVIIGAGRDDINGIDSGSARVISGFDGSVLHTFLGATPGTLLGSSVSNAGDVNSDGFDDVIIGSPRQAPFPATIPGIAEVFSGLDGSLLHSVSQPVQPINTSFGTSVSGAGDINADGFDDFIVGAHAEVVVAGAGSQGRVRVYSGFDGSTLMTLDGFTLQSGFGNAVSDAGDLNADGFDDILISAFRSNHVYAFSGLDGTILHTWSHTNPLGLVGWGESMSTAGDVDNDGFNDVIVGFPDTANHTGLVQLFSGFDGQMIYSSPGPQVSGEFGASVDTAGDVNGDGYDDFLVGAPLERTNSTPVGKVRVYSGKNGSQLATFEGNQLFGFLGIGVATAGDTNADGLDDIIVGASGWSATGTNAGAVWVLVSDLQPVVRFETTGPWPHFLDLQWQPTGGDPLALTGRMQVADATPGGVGAIAASLQSQESTLFGFLPVLLANAPSSLIVFEPVAYDSSGSIDTFIDRQNPSLAGMQVFVQAFQSFPLVLSSNGLRFDVAP